MAGKSKSIFYRTFILFLFSFLDVSDSFSQEVEDGNLNSWFFIYTRFHLNDHFILSNELHERTGRFFSDQGQLLIRPSVDYVLNNQVEFSLGYTFIRAWSYEPYQLPIPRNENNIWEQALLKFDMGKVHFQNRFRQENRWINQIVEKNRNYVIDGNTYRNRFRYRFVATFDLFQLGQSEKAIFFNGFDEIWINQEDNLKPESFARNWLYLGLGYRIDKSSNIQIGYMNQYDKINADTYVSTPIIQFSLIKSFH